MQININDRTQLQEAMHVNGWERLPINPDGVDDITLWDLAQRTRGEQRLRVAIGYTLDDCSVVSGDRYVMFPDGAYVAVGGKTADAAKVLAWLSETAK